MGFYYVNWDVSDVEIRYRPCFCPPFPVLPQRVMRALTSSEIAQIEAKII